MKKQCAFGLILILIVFSACQKLLDPADDTSPSPLLVQLPMSGAPATVSFISGSLSRSGFDTIDKTFTIANDTATADFGQVAAGTWHLSVTAFSADSVALYAGETDVQVQPGIVNTVHLTLDPLTGELVVVVTWGTSSQNALLFDGIDDRVTVDAQHSLLDSIHDQITLEAWINVFNNPVGVKPRIIDRSDNANDDRFLLHLISGSNSVAFNINKNKVYSMPIGLERWVHVAGTYDGATMKIYINGAFQQELAVDTLINVRESPLYIGDAGAESASSGNFEGMIDEVRIWNYARSEYQINIAMHRKLTGSEPGLVGYWQLDAQSGQIAQDLTHNRDGILGKTTAVEPEDPQWIEVTY